MPVATCNNTIVALGTVPRPSVQIAPPLPKCLFTPNGPQRRSKLERGIAAGFVKPNQPHRVLKSG
eukprot:11740714-Alexandrium_andersonii.AAC.1